MANIPKEIRKDAKIVAKQRREHGPKPFTAKAKVRLNPFKKEDVKKIAYVTDYSVRHSNDPKRLKEFHAARSPSLQKGMRDMIDQMDRDYAEHKAWKAANPDYVYPGGPNDVGSSAWSAAKKKK